MGRDGVLRRPEAAARRPYRVILARLDFDDRSYARGLGVGRGRGVGPALGVGVILGVEVAVGVGVSVGVGLGVGTAKAYTLLSPAT